MVSLLRILKLGLVNFWRNIGLSLAAILTISLTLVSLSTFIFVNIFTGTSSEALRNKIDVTINFKDSADEEAIHQIEKQIAQKLNVVVYYISKEEALRNFQARATIRENIRQLITSENNPLPRGLKIRTSQSEIFNEIDQLIKQPQYAPLIDSSSYEDNKLLIERIDKGTNLVQKIGLILTLVFVLIAVMVIFNTVRMTVSSRAQEIEIMRLVGASDSFIRVPFLLEGGLYGLVGALLSLGIIVLGVYYFDRIALQYFSDFIGLFQTTLLKVFQMRLWEIIFVVIGAGIVLGITSSWLSVRRHIRI